LPFHAYTVTVQRHSREFVGRYFSHTQQYNDALLTR